MVLMKIYFQNLTRTNEIKTKITEINIIYSNYVLIMDLHQSSANF